MSIGKKLQELRGEKSRREVALALGVSESAYTKYERDERRPRDSLKQKIARYYGTTVESIFFT